MLMSGAAAGLSMRGYLHNWGAFGIRFVNRCRHGVRSITGYDETRLSSDFPAFWQLHKGAVGKRQRESR